jgi:hypothetical protein
MDMLVGNSPASHQRFAISLETSARAFGREEVKRLGQAMQPKEITACKDETFFPQPCLVAIEPVSNFILVESFVDKRDRATWDTAMKQALADLSVRVVQSTADEGTALRSHAKGLGEHHSPDVFHVQHEICGGVALALTRQVREASEAAGAAEKAVNGLCAKRDAYLESPKAPGRPPHWDTRIGKAEEASILANMVHADAHNRREDFRAANRGLSADYHPVDLETGKLRDAVEVEQRIEKRFAAIDKVAHDAGLSERAKASIEKARRVLPAMKATIAFVLEFIAIRMAALGLPATTTRAVTETLVPAAYLERMANRAPSAERRDALRELAHARRSSALELAPELATLDENKRNHVDRVAAEAADAFQRSSSCVEGRNGQLSLRHHHLHSITPERLEALTVFHNFFIKRPDGSTAAQRFFGLPHRDLFATLLHKAPELSRPRHRVHDTPNGHMLH